MQVYKVGKKDEDHGARTEYDPTDKPITPMGGFVGYGEVTEDYLIIKVPSFHHNVFSCPCYHSGILSELALSKRTVTTSLSPSVQQ
jgi:hypothetical protein